jgi:ketosteroid isomerase-like protein
MKWFEEYYADVDSKDIDRISPWFTDDILLRFGNSPEIHGLKDSLAVLSGFMDTFSSIRHDLVHVIEGGDEVFLSASVTYKMLDGRTVSIPAATYKKRSGQKICEMRVFADFTPMYAAS